jgi:phosphoglycerate dehydrogenase-like enzyme
MTATPDRFADCLDLGRMHRMVTVAVADRPVLEAVLDDPTAVDAARWVHWDLVGPVPEDVPLEDVDVVVLPGHMLRREHFSRLGDLPGLSLVQLPSAGYEHALRHVPETVTLCNGRGVHDDGTAELAVGLLLAVQRGIDEAARDMTEGRWAPRPRSSLADRRVMVLGHGSIGSAVAHRLEAFAVDVVRVASTARQEGDVHVHGVDELPALLPDVDAVVVVLPLSDSTHHLVDAAFLAALPDGAVVVNVGRGKVVDTEALLVELRAGRLRAGLDVTDPEPLPPDHPLWRTPGVLVTPHVGGYTDATTPRLARLLVQQAEALRDGRAPINVVRAATGAAR